MSSLGCFAQIDKTEVDIYETVTVSVACPLCVTVPDLPIFLMIDAPGALPPFIMEQRTCQDFVVSRRYDFFYVEPGTYYITVLINGEEIEKFKITVSKPTAPPLEVDLIASPDMGYPPLEVKFTVKWSGGAPPIDFVIEYPDGTSDKVSGVTDYYPEFTHTFTQPGINLVRVTATDSAGQTVSDWVTVEVLSPPPSVLKFVDENGNPVSGAQITLFDDSGEVITSGTTDQDGEISLPPDLSGEYWTEGFKEIQTRAYDAIAKISFPGSYTLKDSWFTERSMEVTIKLETAGEDWLSSILNGLVTAGLTGAWILWVTPFTPLWQINQIVNGILLDYLKQNQPEGIEFLYAEVNPTDRTITVGFKQKVASPVSMIWAVIALIIAVAIAIGAVALLIDKITSKTEVEARSEALKSASDVYEQAANLLDTVNQKLEAGEISPEEASQIIDSLTKLMQSMEQHIEDLGGTPPSEACKILFGLIDVGPLPEPWCSIANGVSSVAAVGLGAYLAYKLIGLIPKSKE